MEQGYGKGKLVPSGKWAPEIAVNFQITRQANGSSPTPRTVVASMAAEAGHPIALGDFDLLVGQRIVRLKHVANDPEWLILSSDASAIA
jgi:seryl-tRNA(Sec) selenium transferase